MHAFSQPLTANKNSFQPLTALQNLDPAANQKAWRPLMKWEWSTFSYIMMFYKTKAMNGWQSGSLFLWNALPEFQ